MISNELIIDVGDCELNLCYGLWFFFFFGFVTLSLLYLYYIDKRERERERERAEFLEITQVSQIREYLFNCFC